MSAKLLLMTSTIAPAPDTFLLARNDPADRLRDYQAALTFYGQALKAGVFTHVFYVDNSGYPLDVLREQARAMGLADAISFYSYVSTIPPEYSRYFLEINLIHEATRHFPQLSAPNAIIWKVTGRYIVANIAGIVRSFPESADFYANFRNYPERTMDFYLVGYRPRAFAALLMPDRDRYQSQRAGEKILREAIDDGNHADLHIVKRFRVTPRLIGVRGFDGARYGGWKDSVKYGLRRTANAVLPHWWL